MYNNFAFKGCDIMYEGEKAIFTNMCMIYKEDQVLVINRQKSWKGYAFPGGHLEIEESIVDSVKREIKEETNLNLHQISLCGIKQWFYQGIRNVCFLYKCNHFDGELKSSDEGDVIFVSFNQLRSLPLASGMDLMLKVFLDDTISEFYHKKNELECLDILK